MKLGEVIFFAACVKGMAIYFGCCRPVIVEVGNGRSNQVVSDTGNFTVDAEVRC